MIREHIFNSQWLGEPVGIVHDAAFFDQAVEHQQSQLSDYAWVEYFTPLEQAQPYKLHTSNFFQTDTQINFLLNLKKVEVSPSLEQLSYSFADDTHLQVQAEQLAMFTHERFFHLPGIQNEIINQRYALWANQLIAEYPECCLAVSSGGRIQGWFLSQPGEKRGLDLKLAMLAADADISGALLYQQACIAYAQRGHRIGYASFSVTNTDVHNIYASLGAHFMAPTGCWLWLPIDKLKP